MRGEIKFSEIADVLSSFGGTATLAEICRKMEIKDSYTRESVLVQCGRNCDKVSVNELQREYFTHNTGSVKWAYRLRPTKQ